MYGLKMTPMPPQQEEYSCMRFEIEGTEPKIYVFMAPDIEAQSNESDWNCNSFSSICLIDGSAKILYEGKHCRNVLPDRNHLCFIPPNVLHKVTCVKQGCRGVVVFSNEMLNFISDSVLVQTVKERFFSGRAIIRLESNDSAEEINEILEMLYRESVSVKRDFLWRECVGALLKVLFVKCLRYSDEARQTENGKYFGDIYSRYMALVDRFYRQKHKVVEYVDILGITYKELVLSVAAFDERKPLQIIHDRLLDEAKRMLAYTESSIKTISLDLGFEEDVHFHKFFKRNTGITATGYRNLV